MHPIFSLSSPNANEKCFSCRWILFGWFFVAGQDRIEQDVVFLLLYPSESLDLNVFSMRSTSLYSHNTHAREKLYDREGGKGRQSGSCSKHVHRSRTRNYMKTRLIQIFFRMQKYNYLMNEKENEMQKDRNYFSYM